MTFVRYLCLGALLVFGTSAQCFDPAQQDDSLALVRHFKVPEKPLEMPEEGGLIGDDVGLTVSLMGGTDVFRMQEFGTFDFYLQVHAPDQYLRVRNLGWPGDTVYRQQRPMFFYTEEGDTREGSEPDGREKIEPGVFVLSFGKMESLDGLERLGEFEEAYDRLLAEFKKLTHRIALVEPVAFSRSGPAAELAEERNEVLEKYTEVIEKLAAKRGVMLVRSDQVGDHPKFIEPTGIHLGYAALQSQAFALVHQALGIKGIWNKHPGFGRDFPMLRDLIDEKNRLWDQYYRPTNWAFLYGDRQHVPSSRDHKDSDRRWFIEELNRIPGLISEKEEEIWAWAKEVEL
ncbi:MAG: hypothetical protein AAGF67_10060 [Verrucomicrobiota bacterium]